MFLAFADLLGLVLAGPKEVLDFLLRMLWSQRLRFLNLLLTLRVPGFAWEGREVKETPSWVVSTWHLLLHGWKRNIYDALLADIAGFLRRGQAIVLMNFNARVGWATECGHCLHWNKRALLQHTFRFTPNAVRLPSKELNSRNWRLQIIFLLFLLKFFCRLCIEVISWWSHAILKFTILQESCDISIVIQNSWK